MLLCDNYHELNVSQDEDITVYKSLLVDAFLCNRSNLNMVERSCLQCLESRLAVKCSNLADWMVR